ncbi:hypothetical protein D3C73_854730 [compost metagenome]
MLQTAGYSFFKKCQVHLRERLISNYSHRDLRLFIIIAGSKKLTQMIFYSNKLSRDDISLYSFYFTAEHPRMPLLQT